jgi:rod shape-determining protein MreD
MIYWFAVPTLALLAALQSSLLAELTFLDGRPELVLIAVIAWAIADKPRQAMVLGLIGGIFLDLLSSLPVGTSSIPLVLIAFLVSFTGGRLWQAHFLLPMATTLVGSLFYHAFGMAILLAAGRSIDINLALSRVILPSTFLNVVLAMPFTQLIVGLRNRLYPPEVEI